ncbi:hypothetical protein SAMN05216223_104104 [Actinacidiphila yanglinensis]|uniref:Uncharacterized protein n=1 Tax=Actinacidiphila yanglinensis TaxID=310779 RepID=A0A1H5YSK4_9ACTN|nr:hypothetical protein SAMN05216223_104104 [Actinacidiphila yanglinensis]
MPVAGSDAEPEGAADVLGEAESDGWPEGASLVGAAVGEPWAVGRGLPVAGVPPVTWDAPSEGVVLPPGEVEPLPPECGAFPSEARPCSGAYVPAPGRASVPPAALAGARLGPFESGVPLPALTHAATAAATTATIAAARTPERRAAPGWRGVPAARAAWSAGVAGAAGAAEPEVSGGSTGAAGAGGGAVGVAGAGSTSAPREGVGAGRAHVVRRRRQPSAARARESP